MNATQPTLTDLRAAQARKGKVARQIRQVEQLGGPKAQRKLPELRAQLEAISAEVDQIATALEPELAAERAEAEKATRDSIKRSAAEEAAFWERFHATEARKEELAAFRRQLLSALRSMGFSREHTSGRSAYYSHASGRCARVSDHVVPMTEHRADAAWNGRETWADTDGWNFVVNVDADLDALRTKLNELREAVS